MAYHLHDLKVTGMELKEILSCTVEGNIGEHSTLTLQAYAEEEQALLYHTPSYQPLEVWLEGEEGSEILFAGLITNIHLMVSGNLKIIMVEAKSNSWLLDLEKRDRSFQNIGMTYEALIRQVLSMYSNSSVSYATSNISIGSLLVQYEETDWTFLKRVLSKLGVTMTPESRQSGIRLYAGIPEFPIREVPYQIVSMEKDMDTFYYLKANGRKVYAADFTRYQIASSALMGIFEKVKIGEQVFTIDSFQYVFDGQEMIGIYSLQKAKGLLEVERYPMNLIGVALSGNVTKVSGDKVQVNLEIDKSYGTSGSYWFPYSTMSASSNGTGWYCMPEEGDEIRIYFPSKQEKEAIALSAVSGYETPTNGQEDRMQNPDSRYLRAKTGQELALAPEYARLSSGNGISAVTVLSNGTVSISGASRVVVSAQEKLSVHAEEKITIHAKESVALQSTSGGCVYLDKEKIYFQGTEVKFD